MDRNRYVEIRFEDEVIKERVLEARRQIVTSCKICNGSGFSGYSDDDTAMICSCMKRFNKVKNIILSGAPRKAEELLDKISTTGKNKLIDVDYKRVMLSIDVHDIREINRTKKLYKQLLIPFVANAEQALKNGDSITLFGDNSRGKTWGLYFVLINLMAKFSALFITMKDLFIFINLAYYGSENNREAAEHKKRALDMLALVRDVDILLLDEGSKLPKFGDNVSVQLEGILKDRIGNRKSVVMATNHSPVEFYQNFGPQVVSACIEGMYSAHILNGQDLRHRAMNEGNSFSYLKEDKHELQ